MKKLFKTLAMAVVLGTCVGSFALGGATKASADLTWDTMVELENRMPECGLFLETAKIKNMTDWGYYNVDGEDVWYFKGDNVGGQGKNPEIRFVTEGTDTSVKINGSYTFDPYTVESFSFMYRIENNSQYTKVDDIANQYIVQVLASDGSYPIIKPQVTANGDWHLIEVNKYTPVENAKNGATTYEGINYLFSGFIFKMAGLDGELMISNIEVVLRGGAVLPPLNPYEPELPETSEEPTVSEEPEIPETSEPIVSEEPEAPETSEPTNNQTPDEEKSGCGAAISGVSTLFALAGAGFVMAIRKRKE